MYGSHRKADSRPCTCRGFMLALLLSFLLPFVVLAQTPRPKLAMLDFHDSSGETVNQQEIQYLSNLVRGAARLSLPADQFIIMTRENIFDLLPRGTSLADCFDDCAIELGRNIGADYVATGEITQFAGELRVVVTLHETNSGNLLGQVRAGATSVLAIESELEGQVSTLLQPLRGVGSVPQFDDAGRPIGVESQEWDPSFTSYHVVGFETDPPGAEVRIAGQYRGVTPCSRELTEGSHEITLRLPRYEEHHQTVSVTGPATIRRKLTPLFGWISVTTEPSGLPIMLDGHQIGMSPIVRHEIEPGRHAVKVEDARYEPAGLEGFSLGSSEHRELDFKPTPRLGGLRVSAVTADSKRNALSKPVQIDGREAGSTPWSGRLIVGRHRVTVEGEVREVTVVERETREEVFEVAVTRPVQSGRHRDELTVASFPVVPTGSSRTNKFIVIGGLAAVAGAGFFQHAADGAYDDHINANTVAAAIQTWDDYRRSITLRNVSLGVAAGMITWRLIRAFSVPQPDDVRIVTVDWRQQLGTIALERPAWHIIWAHEVRF